MSRVIVKNLPRYVNEGRLKDIFSSQGTITDVKLKKTADGKSRQFAFIGFKSEEEAESAVKYFNKSFIDTQKISVEVAKKIGEENMARPWSKHSISKEKSEDKSAEDQLDKKHSEHVLSKKNMKSPESNKNGQKIEGTKKAMTKKDIFSEYENDPQFREFIEIMLPKNSKKIWGNNTFNEIIDNNNNVDGDNRNDEIGDEKGKSLKTKTLENELKVDGELKKGKVMNQSTLKDNQVVQNSDDEYENVIDDIDASDKANDSNLTDLDYLKSKMTTEFSDDDDDDDDEDDENDDDEDDQAIENVTDEENELKDDKAKSAVRKKLNRKEKVEMQLNQVDELDENDVGEIGMKVEDDQKNTLKELVTVDDTSAATNNNTNNGGVNSDKLEENGRLFVKNLCYTTTEDELCELFENFGNVSEVHIVKDKVSKTSKGFGYVLFSDPNDSMRALQELDGTFFQGRVLQIDRAKKNENLENKKLEKENVNSIATSQYKSEKEESVKSKEEKGFTKAWNSLFINADTVARGMSTKYGIEKRDLLDSHGTDTAVKLSLAETQMISETKKFLEEEGVDVSLLEKFSASRSSFGRSKKIILVKNLPYSTTRNEILALFSKFGSIHKCVFPPTKALAIVEFSQISEAKFAFRGLSYKRLQHAPLYLEWAPENIFVLPENHGEKLITDDNRSGEKNTQEFNLENNSQLQNFDSVESCSVFVKNLNFSTTEDALKKHFEKKFFSGSIRKVLIKKKKNVDGSELSMGFGFVEFVSNKVAIQACKKLQGSFLDGHSLALELSKDKVQGKETGVKKISTKLIVRNVAFEATRKDLLQLFSPFGQVKSLRLPRSYTGKHRGFAFVEFVTKQEAKNAFEALQNSHLYGRHLVFENANENSSLEELRAKTALQMEHLAADEKLKKRRKVLNAADDFDMDEDDE